MGNGVYSNRFHSQVPNRATLEQSQYSAPSQNQAQGAAAQEELTVSQQALLNRYQEAQTNIDARMGEIQSKYSDLSRGKAPTENKLETLQELESLLAELKNEQNIYTTLGSSLSMTGMQTNEANIQAAIRGLSQDISSLGQDLTTQKAAEDAKAADDARVAQEAQAAEQAEQARLDKIEENKNKAAAHFRDLKGHFNGNPNKEQYRGDNEVNHDEAAMILEEIASAIKSDKWSAVKDRINNIEISHKDEAISLVVHVIKNNTPKEYQQLIPQDVYGVMSDNILQGDDADEFRIKVGDNSSQQSNKDQKITHTTYSTYAVELGSQSLEYQLEEDKAAEARKNNRKGRSSESGYEVDTSKFDAIVSDFENL